MSESLTPEACCGTCDDVTTNIPGPQGNAGTAGADGADGCSAVTTTTEEFIMPGCGYPGSAEVTVAVVTTGCFCPGIVIYIENAGYFRLLSIVDATHLLLENLCLDVNAAEGVAIAAGSCVSVGGEPGADGTNGTSGGDGIDGINAFTVTAANFTQPAELATVVVTVAESSWAAIGQNVFVPVGGYYEVTGMGAGTLTLKNLEDAATDAYLSNAAPATVIASGSDVSPGGIQGPIGPAGAPGGLTSITHSEVIGAGTDYTLTNAYAKLNFGTTDADITLMTSGDYLIQAIINVLARAGSTFDTVRFKIRDTTNNVDVAEQTIIFENQNRTQVVLSDIFTSSGGEIIQLWGINDTLAGGTVFSTETKIWYLKLS